MIKQFQLKPSDKPGRYQVIVEGIDISRFLTDIKLDFSAGCLPVVTLTAPMMPKAPDIDLPDCMIKLVDQSQQLRTKEPCPECVSWEARNAQVIDMYAHYEHANELPIYKYCPDCGRPLGGELE